LRAGLSPVVQQSKLLGEPGLNDRHWKTDIQAEAGLLEHVVSSRLDDQAIVGRHDQSRELSAFDR